MKVVKSHHLKNRKELGLKKTMKCPKCGSNKFEPVGTVGYLFTGYVSYIRCLQCGKQVRTKERCEKKGLVNLK